MAQNIGGKEVNTEESTDIASKEVTVTKVGTKTGLDVNLTSGDIQIGAVEIKDGDTDRRANVIVTNGFNGLVAIAPGHVSTDNSTSSVLGAGAVYTGTWEDITNFGVIVITLKASHASATDGLEVEFSSDGTNIDSTDEFTVPAATGKTFSFQSATKYFRVKYTNGGTLQTYFRLQTTLKPYYVKPSSHRIHDSIIDEDDAELVKAVLTGANPAGTFVNFQSTIAGNFKVSIEEYEADAAPWGTDLEGGGKISVGTSEVEVTFTGDTKSIIITADIDNTGTLYVGKTGVTNTGGNALTFLNAGDEIILDYNDADNAIYVIASVVSQNFWQGAVL